VDDSPGEYIKTSEGLLRQRRNLIVSSIVFLLVCLGGARIGAISIGVGTISFDRPSVIYVGLWIVEIYFLIRYLQYLGSEEQLIKNAVHLYRNRANVHLNERFREAELTGSPDRWSYVSVHLFGPTKEVK